MGFAGGRMADVPEDNANDELRHMGHDGNQAPALGMRHGADDWCGSVDARHLSPPHLSSGTVKRVLTSVS
eukprot:scaffold7066_cov253-Pinguiococcus_pyrenoidosus.AAC.51